MDCTNHILPLIMGLSYSNFYYLEVSEIMSEEMMNDITDDDKLWAALAYVFTPLIPIIILLMEDKKDRPFIKAHNIQAMAWGILVYALTFILSFVLVGFCIGIAGFAAQLWWAYKNYQGEYIEIPVITNFVKNQGWA